MTDAERLLTRLLKNAEIAVEKQEKITSAAFDKLEEENGFENHRDACYALHEATGRRDGLAEALNAMKNNKN